MKLIVFDLTHQYNICIVDVDKYDLAVELAQKYVKQFFKDYNNQTPEIQKHHMQDVIKHKIIGIDISTVDYNQVSNDTRTNHFFGHIKENGTIVNKNEVS